MSKDQLFETSGLEFDNWLLRSEKFSGLSRNRPLNRQRYRENQIFTKLSDVNRYTTRSSNTPLFKTASGQGTPYYRTVSIWNSLKSN